MKKKGFTLVELLVVIAILAILATVSIVGYTQFIAKSRQSVCLQEATQVRDLLIAEDINNKYFTIQDGKIIMLQSAGAGNDTTDDDVYYTWADPNVASNEFKKDLGNLAKNIEVHQAKEGKGAEATFYYVTEGYYAKITFDKGIDVEEGKPVLATDNAKTPLVPAE